MSLVPSGCKERSERRLTQRFPGIPPHATGSPIKAPFPNARLSSTAPRASQKSHRDEGLGASSDPKCPVPSASRPNARNSHTPLLYDPSPGPHHNIV